MILDLVVLFTVAFIGSASAENNGVIRIPISTNSEGTIFYTTTTIGVEEEIFLNVALDTGSNGFLYPSAFCDWQFDWCRTHGGYNYLESHSYVNPHKNFSAEIGGFAFGGVTLQGRLAIDQIEVGDVTFENKMFGEIISSSFDFNFNDFFDGLIGLGRSKTSATGVPIQHILLSEGELDDAVFSFSINPTKPHAGDLIIGEVDHGRYTGPLSWTRVISDTKWEVNMDSIDIGDTNICTGSCKADFSTGVELIVGPNSQVEAIYKILEATAIPAVAIRFVDCKKMHTYPSLTFTVNGNKVPLTPRDYITKTDFGPGREFCTLNFLGLEEPQEEKWILGAIAHKSLYVVYNFGLNQIGLAKAAN